MVVKPNSLVNLNYTGGTKPRYEAKKKRRHLSVTDIGWSAAKKNIKSTLGVSVSEAIELIGRGEYELVKKEDTKKP